MLRGSPNLDGGRGNSPSSKLIKNVNMEIERKLFCSNYDADRYVKEKAERGHKLISYSLRKGGLFDLSVGLRYNIEATMVWDE